MPGRLEGKVVLVTGATSGIGRAVAERAAAEGARVVLAGRRDELGQEVAGGIREAGGVATFVRTDVTKENEVADLVAATLAEHGRLDGAMNNVGGVSTFDKLADVSTADWQAELDLNLTSVFYCLRHELAAMRGKGGSIVNNASLLGVTGVSALGPYTAAKHGVVGLTKTAALENAKAGPRVNVLVTGNVDTPLYRGLLPPDVDPEQDVPNPTGRLARPAEIAAFVTFLLSDEAPFITGASLAIDGGFTAT